MPPEPLHEAGVVLQYGGHGVTDQLLEVVEGRGRDLAGVGLAGGRGGRKAQPAVGVEGTVGLHVWLF